MTTINNNGYTTESIEASLNVKDQYSFDVALLRSMSKTVDKIRYLTKCGISTKEISLMINIRYQHVNNEQGRLGLKAQAKINNNR